jgi:hypothetical protein
LSSSRSDGEEAGEVVVAVPAAEGVVENVPARESVERDIFVVAEDSIQRADVIADDLLLSALRAIDNHVVAGEHNGLFSDL